MRTMDHSCYTSSAYLEVGPSTAVAVLWFCSELSSGEAVATIIVEGSTSSTTIVQGTTSHTIQGSSTSTATTTTTTS
jgi:hypothetical protein